jgi:hypothetical protein
MELYSIENAALINWHALATFLLVAVIGLTVFHAPEAFARTLPVPIVRAAIFIVGSLVTMGFAAATIKTCNSRIALREEMTAGRCASVDGFIREYSKSRVRGERFAIQFRVNDQRFTLGNVSDRVAYNDSTVLKPGMRVGILYCGDEIVRVTIHGR